MANALPPSVPADLLVSRLAHQTLLHRALRLPQTSLFLASLLYSLLLATPNNLTGRLLYAAALLDAGAPHSALHLVKASALAEGDLRLAEVGARACDQLGRNREGRELLERTLERREERLSSSDGVAAIDEDPLHPPAPTPDEQQSSTQCLLARLATKGNEPLKAAEHYLEALKLNPFCWEAFEGLCAIGHFVPLANVFPALQSPPASASAPATSSFLPPPQNQAPGLGGSNLFAQAGAPSRRHLQDSKTQPAATGMGFFTPGDSGVGGGMSLFGVRKDRDLGSRGVSSSPPPSQQHSFASAYPSLGTAPPTLSFAHLGGPSASGTISTPVGVGLEDGAGKPPVMKRQRGPGRAQVGGAYGRTEAVVQGSTEGRNATGRNNANGLKSKKSINQTPAQQLQTPAADAATTGVRRSSRLSSTTAGVQRPSRYLPNRDKRRPGTAAKPSSAASSATSTSLDMPMSPPQQQVAAPSVAFSDLDSPSAANTSAGSSGSAAADLLTVDNWILGVLRTFGRATILLAQYECAAAVKELDALPACVVRGNPRVSGMLGRCWFELVDYTKAKRAFLHSRALDPYRLADMDLFSTLLWHLHDPVSLAHLAQELLAIDRLSPEAWIAVGNAFSLQKEHDEALRCFRRATQLDPRCAYASTLSGHEAVSMEEFDRAIAFFQTAVRTDRRHFNAWYGLGTAYLRKNKLRQAEHHFRRALALSPSNAVLLCCVGQVLERRNRREEALELYQHAHTLAPDSPMVAFRRAKALFGVGRVDEALPTLEALARTAPHEFNVHFLLGKIYKLVGDPAGSARSFALALDLDPKMSGVVKQAQEPVAAPEEEEDGNESAMMEEEEEQR